VLLAHGTADERGQAVVYSVAEAVSRRLPATEVVVGFVDVCAPGADEALARHGDNRAVVVPYLLSSGFHVRHDIPAAVARHGGEVGLTPALGVAPEVVHALCDRFADAVTGPGGAGEDRIDAVVVAGAGSSDAGARREVMCLAALVAASLSLPTRAGFLSGDGPSAASCVNELRRRGAKGVAVLPALLAPGFFVAKAGRLGADVVAPALGVHPALVDLVVRRYGEAS
ncbi:MAG: sirohydrochlorin chelatase, partial [Ornithinimicrobium sp.]